MLNPDALQEIAPRGKIAIFLALMTMEPFLTETYRIGTPLRMAHFLSQCALESTGFTVVAEDLHYSAEGLLKTFPSRVTAAQAAQYGSNKATGQQSNPEAIGNLVYGNRPDLGNNQTGDGYKFRGRGLIQLTGRANYTAFAESKRMPVDDVIDYLGTVEGAVESAGWFWWKNGLNALADGDDVLLVTRRVNGGTLGLSERTYYLQRAKACLRDERRGFF